MDIRALDVSAWQIDDEHAIFPFGARDKELLWSPNESVLGLKPNWSYLFKLSRPSYPDQYWMETVAYIVGTAMGISVPLAWPAFKKTTDGEIVCGSAIEWFYERGTQTFTHAADYFQKTIEDFDSRSGAQHNIEDLITFCRMHSLHSDLSPEWDGWFFDLLLFDALIGNSDRHQENWGFVFDPLIREGSKRKVYLSPLFDNGTSLGHERFPDRVINWTADDVDRYLFKGRHHLRRTRDDSKSRIKHLEGIEKLSEINPKARQRMLEKLDFDLDNLLASIYNLCNIDIAVPLTFERAEWTTRLLKRRYQLIKKTLQDA